MPCADCRREIAHDDLIVAHRDEVAALATGFIMTLLLQDFLWKGWLGIDFALAFSWKMLIATMFAFGVCCAGKGKVDANTI